MFPRSTQSRYYIDVLKENFQTKRPPVKPAGARADEKEKKRKRNKKMKKTISLNNLPESSRALQTR